MLNSETEKRLSGGPVYSMLWVFPHFQRRELQQKEPIARMAPQKSATTHLNRGLRIFFSEFVRVSLRRPSQALFFARTILWQSRAAHRHIQHHQ